MIASACAFLAQLYAARFAPLYGEPEANLTREEAGDAAAAAAAEEGRGAAKMEWSLEQVAACLVALPREGAPEADGALRAAIAAAAACCRLTQFALVPPWYEPGAATSRHPAPYVTGARVSRALGSGLPSALSF